jgi:glycosyltransferase involved in cell wall biosynthesis
LGIGEIAMINFGERHNWSSSYGIFSRVIEEKQLKIGAEIGVASGGHSESILKTTSVQLLYGIDSYQHRDDYVDAMNLPQSEFEQLYEYTTKRLAVFGDRYCFIRKDSQEAVNDVDGEIDFVYIDADHSYKGVWNDLCTWYPKIRIGGIIGGHDYNHPSFPGVTQAVNEFFRRFDWKINYEGEHIWWVEKKPLNISFFIPAYNCAQTLKESVDSIMKSNFSEGDEVVIVNDGSTDSTESVLSQLKELYPKIRIFKHSANRGGGAARNTAVEHCIHPILFCLDSDNVLESNSIQKLKEYMQNTGADVAAFQELYFFKENKECIDFKWTFKEEENLLAEHLCTTQVPGSSGNYMFTKESWLRAAGYPEVVLDTWGFGFRQVMTGSKVYVMPNSFYYHRYGHDSYWIRGAEKRKKAVSMMALQVLIPFSDQIDERYLDYIMSRKGRYTWFSKLSKKPIRLVTSRKKQLVWQTDGKSQNSENTFLEKQICNFKGKVKYLLFNFLLHKS